MLYVVDTETNGLPSYFYPKVSNFDDWPRLVSIAYKKEVEGEETGIVENIVRPDGYKISESSTRIHGITHEAATKNGIPIKKTLSDFLTLLMEDEDPVLCAYNAEFDRGVLASECYRHNLVEFGNFLTGPSVQWVCLMKRAQRALKRTPSEKYLKLQECVNVFTKSHETSKFSFHTASGDVSAACFILHCIINLEERQRRNKIKKFS